MPLPFLSLSLQFRESFPSPPFRSLIKFYNLMPPRRWSDGMDEQTREGAEAAKFQRSDRKFHVDCTLPDCLFIEAIEEQNNPPSEG